MKHSNFRRKTYIAYFIFVLPAAALFAMWIVIPFFQGIPIALSDWNGITKTYNYIGLTNFKNIINSQNYVDPLLVTLKYTLIAAGGANLLGLLLALGLQRTTRLNTLLRTIFFMTFVMSVVLCAYMWRYVFSDILYTYFKIRSPIGKASTVVQGLGLMAIWRDSGYCMIIYLAGLKMIPVEYYEAALVDGAHGFNRFFSITLPLLVPSLSANVVLMMSWGLRQFDLVMAATGGGPGTASETLAVWIYKNIFLNNKFGYGQAIAILFTIFIAALSSIVSYVIRRREVQL